MKLLDLAKKYAAGKADPSDFEGLSSEEVLAIRTDKDMGCNVIAATCPFPTAESAPYESLAAVDEDDDSPVPYVMLTEHPLGKMRDLYRVNGFSMEKFNKRGRPLLYHHNLEVTEERPPLGTMSRPTRHRKYEGLRAMHGYASFAPRGINAFGDMIQDLVRAGVLRGGSVGMEIEEARAPKDDKEANKLGVQPYSLIIESAHLEEFSVTPMGRDENAQAGVVLSADGEQEALSMLVDGVREGRYDREVVAAFREATPGLEPPLRILSNGIDLPSEANPDQEDDMKIDLARVEALESRLARMEELNDEQATALSAMEDRCEGLEQLLDDVSDGLGAIVDDGEEEAPEAQLADQEENTVGRALYEELLADDMTDDDIEALLGDLETA